MNTREHNAEPLNTPRAYRREPGIDPDTRNVTLGILLAVAMGIFLLALAMVAIAGELPASVLVTEHDYQAGTFIHECWLDSAQYGQIGKGYGLIVECHSDLDGIFTSGFEP